MSKDPLFAMIDGNEAAARVAYALNEVIAIYPITPASASELAVISGGACTPLVDQPRMSMPTQR